MEAWKRVKVTVPTKPAIPKVALDDGHVLTASAVVVATGVTALEPGDVSWSEAPETRPLSPLWRAAPENLEGRRVVVLGADRPLGTWLRAYPQAAVHLDVLFSETDRYKIDEVADDPRIRLGLVGHVTVAPVPKGFRVTASHPDGGAHVFVVDTVLSNIGSKPAAIPGLVAGADGCCPPDEQHPRILVAGDLKGAPYAADRRGLGRRLESGSGAVLPGPSCCRRTVHDRQVIARQSIAAS
ncbi:hypothetical protein [Streptomyces nondiastaticus]|uniref:FAD/NAD(P)-binding domain-containing protein n=1 Tax=Streptomyces nondiastaticus TaxID=3154512 RepID=A0ABW6U4J1_9ACTN